MHNAYCDTLCWSDDLLLVHQTEGPGNWCQDVHSGNEWRNHSILEDMKTSVLSHMKGEAPRFWCSDMNAGASRQQSPYWAHNVSHRQVSAFDPLLHIGLWTRHQSLNIEVFGIFCTDARELWQLPIQRIKLLLEFRMSTYGDILLQVSFELFLKLVFRS